MTEVIHPIILGIAVGLVYSLIAVGFVLIYKASHVFNIAQGELFMLGAFICWSFINQVGLSPILSIVFTLVVAAGVGMLINRLLIAPLVGQPLIAVIMVTIVLGLLLRAVVHGIWLGPTRALGITLGEPFHLGDIAIGQHYVYFFVAAIIVFGFLAFLFRFTKAGLAMRATADAHQVAQATGVKVTGVFNQVWAGAALVAALGGVLLTMVYDLHSEVYILGYKAFPVLILGGLDSVTGVLIAGPIVGILEQLAMYYLDPIVGGGTGEVVPYVILLVALLVKPYGLMGLRRIERI